MECDNPAKHPVFVQSEFHNMHDLHLLVFSVIFFFSSFGKHLRFVQDFSACMHAGEIN